MKRSTIIKLIVAVAAFSLLNWNIRENSEFFSKRRSYLRNLETARSDERIHALVLGDSHAVNLAPDNPEIRTLSFGAEGIPEMYAKLRYLLEGGVVIENLFLIAEYQTFNGFGSPNRTYLNNVFLRMEDDVYRKSKLSHLVDNVPLFNDDYIDYLRTSMRHHLNDVKSLVAGQAQAGVDGPGLREKRAWASRPRAERAAIARRTGLVDHLGMMTDVASMELYRRLVELARAHGVEVYGIAYPVTAEYLEGCPLPERRRVDEFLESLDIARILDYSALIDDPTYFRNEDHINEKGAKLLAEQIRRDTGVRF